MRLTSIEFSFDPCNVYRDGLRGVGYPADARSVGGAILLVRTRCTSSLLLQDRTIQLSLK